MLVPRESRKQDEALEFIFHQGRIATGNSVVQDGELRDQLKNEIEGLLCIEIEAAGVSISKPCLVIRGISDYSDAHKNDKWKMYAAGKAAAFAREFLRITNPWLDTIPESFTSSKVFRGE